MPVEATEQVGPVLIWRKELRADSGGAGQGWVEGAQALAVIAAIGNAALKRMVPGVSDAQSPDSSS